MPDAPLRACPRCGRLSRGRCQLCARQGEQQRGNWYQRFGRDWEKFRERFPGMLIEAGVRPICGEAMPGGPREPLTACAVAGLETYRSADRSKLHLDHQPKLEDWEPRTREIVCDPMRVRLSCRECHSAKTALEASAR